MSEVASISVGLRLDLTGFRREILELGRFKIPDLNVGVGLNTSGIDSQLQGLQRRANESGSQVGQQFAKGIQGQNSLVEGIVQGIGQTVATGLVGAMSRGVSAVAGLGKSVLDAGVASEKSATAFTVFLGSAQRAQRVLKDVTEFAAATPFELPEVKSAAQSLLAFGVTAENLKPALTSIGNIAAAVGVPFNELAQIYGKAKTQGRLFMEDINQLTGRGIPIVEELAKQFKVSTSQVKDLVSSGKVGFEQMNQAFTSMTGEGGKFEGLMDKLSKTTGGKLTNLADSITQTYVEIFETISPVINATLDLVVKLLGSIKVNFVGVNDLAKDFAKLLSDNSDNAIALGQAISSGVNAAMKALNIQAKRFSDYLAKNPEVVEMIRDALTLVANVAKILADRMKEGLGHLGGMVDGFGKVLATVSKVYDKIKDFIASLSSFKPPDWLQNIMGMGIGGEEGAFSGVPGQVQFPISGHNARENATGGGGAFGAPREYGPHSGQDYAYAKNTRVNAGINGIVTEIDEDNGEYIVNVKGVDVNGRTIETRAVHLESKTVKVGDRVGAGQQIGTVGGDSHSWGSTGTHFHITTKINGKVVEPKLFFDTVKQAVPLIEASKAAGKDWANSGGGSNAVQTLLNIISAGESDGNINARNGRHFGKYQFRDTTRAALKNKTGLDPWSSSEAEQDKAAEAHIKYNFPKAWAALQRGDIATAIDILNDNEWVSLPGGPQNHKWKNRSIDSIIKEYGGSGTGGDELSLYFYGGGAFHGLNKKSPTGGLPGKYGFGATVKKGIFDNLTANSGFNYENFDASAIANRGKGSLEDLLGGHRQDTQFQEGYATAELENQRIAAERTEKAMNALFATNDKYLTDSGTQKLFDVAQTERNKQALDDWIDSNRQLLASQQQVNVSLDEAYRDFPERFGEMSKAAKELGATLIDTVGGGVKSAFSDLIKGTKSLGDVLLDFVGNLASSLADMALNQIFGSASGGTGILGSIFGGLFGGGGRSSSPLGGLLGGSGRTIIDVLKGGVPHLAEGGIVTKPTFALIGESGPEKVTPLSKLEPASKKRDVAIGTLVEVHYHSPGQISKDGEKELTRTIQNVVRTTLVREQKNGGLLNR